MGEVNLALLGPGARERSDQYRPFQPDRIFICDHPALADSVDDVTVEALARITERVDPEFVVMAATRRGRSFAARLAHRLGAGCVTEAIEIEFEEGRMVTGRYALGGNTVSREAITTAIKVVGIMPGLLEAEAPGSPSGEIVQVELDLSPSRVQVVERQEKPRLAVDIEASERLVCVGRGLKAEEDIELAQGLAAALDAELACTRPLSSELEWMSEDRMIGISGKRCNPKLLFSIGVSGQVQHTVGIMGANLIVAINDDPSAPIFDLADYGAVGDLYELVPALTREVERRG
jgi:electron transfer flavoprotein alpha subunit